jgi:hypothetical protein
MKVYHGSDTAINEIDFEKCKFGKDFGRGFYVTKLCEQAETMAERVARWSKKQPVVTELEFDEFALIDNDLNILQFDNYSGDWFDFIILNRMNKKREQAHDYDIVEGPVANDDISKRITDYLNKEITKEEFLIDLVYKHPSHQICFCTIKSLQVLTLSRYHIDRKIINIDNEIAKALIACGMTEIEAAKTYYKSNTYTHLADESTESYEKPWQEIYELLKQELVSLHPCVAFA